MSSRTWTSCTRPRRSAAPSTRRVSASKPPSTSSSQVWSRLSTRRSKDATRDATLSLGTATGVVLQTCATTLRRRESHFAARCIAGSPRSRCASEGRRACARKRLCLRTESGSVATARSSTPSSITEKCLGRRSTSTTSSVVKTEIAGLFYFSYLPLARVACVYISGLPKIYERIY